MYLTSLKFNYKYVTILSIWKCFLHGNIRRAVATGGWGFQFLAEQLTLSQPGGRLCPPQYYDPPPSEFQTLRRPFVVYHVHVQCSFETYIIYVRQ